MLRRAECLQSSVTDFLKCQTADLNLTEVTATFVYCWVAFIEDLCHGSTAEFSSTVFLIYSFLPKAFPKRILNLSLKPFFHTIKFRLPLPWKGGETWCSLGTSWQMMLVLDEILFQQQCSMVLPFVMSKSHQPSDVEDQKSCWMRALLMATWVCPNHLAH